jgi:hypothetical protein
VQAKLATIESIPHNAFSGVINRFLTPRHSFKDGTLLKPVQLDNKKVTEDLSDLTNTQMVKKRSQKKLKRVLHAANELQDAVIGEEGCESAKESL